MISPTCIAIVNPSNNPLLVRTCLDQTDKDEAIRLIYLMHASLDIVQEKAEQPTSRDNFLGVLYQCEQYKIYGLMSTTKVKILLMINQRFTFGTPRENDIRLILKNIHKAYIDATAMNPFYKPNEPIKSKRLDSYLDSLFSTSDLAAITTTTGSATATTSPVPPQQLQPQQPLSTELPTATTNLQPQTTSQTSSAQVNVSIGGSGGNAGSVGQVIQTV